jgi:hypothetical protein
MPADVIEQLRMLRDVLDAHAAPVTFDDLRRTDMTIRLEPESTDVVHPDPVGDTEPGHRWTKRVLALAAVLAVVVGLAIIGRQDRGATGPGPGNGIPATVASPDPSFTITTNNGLTAFPLTHPETGPTVVEVSDTTVPLGNRAPIAIGDSVMLGAKPELERFGFVVEASEARQANDVIELVHQLRTDGRLGNTVVIHIGTNGEVTDDDLAAIMANLPSDEVSSVWFLTVSGDRPWVAANNQRIVTLPSSYPNVQVGYWYDLAVNLPGRATDGIHLASDEAKQFYADLIATWTGIRQ